MTAPVPIRLRFGHEISETVQARMSYAFRVFAAIFNYQVVAEDSDATAACVVYGDARFLPVPGQLVIPARYSAALDSNRTPQFTKHRYANEDFHLVFGRDEQTGNPDWLGEIFQWLSSSHELGILERDPVGRIPCRDSLFAANGISPRKPHASLLMAWMENALRNGNVDEALCRAPSPVPGVQHLVVCSHDIDFYYTNRTSALLRLIKNIGISIRVYRSWSFFRSNSVMILELLGGKRVGDYLPALLQAIGHSDFRSTFFVVTEQHHRRDPNYRLSELAPRLAEAQSKGCSVCVHGSYTSVLGDGNLRSEVSALEDVLGHKPLGSRQHWLRFDDHQKLFAAIENSQLLFDSTLGFPEAPGFRNGASFAFPPYNFSAERPYNFLEIPLLLMDGNLQSESRVRGEDPQSIADEVLAQSRKFGWGGVAALWHNPMEPLGVPEKINQVFWKCAGQRAQFAEKWMSATEFLECALGRYQNAGLLHGVQLHA